MLPDVGPEIRHKLQRLLLFAMLCTAGAVAAPAQAQQAQADAKVVVVSQLSFFKVDDLEFGEIIPGNAISVVRVFPNGTRSVISGNAILVGNNQQVARFAGRGSLNQQVLISVSPASFNITGPGAPMQVSQLEIGSTPTVILTGTPQRFTINNPSGIFNFPVGARLRVNANQAPGVYSGSFVITLNYQ